jgi:hypothetical protein
MAEEWQGEERRGIPIHILNHIDERLEQHTSRVDNQFVEVRNQVMSLTLSINAWMEKEPESIAERCEKIIDEAIPTSPDNPDSTPKEKRKEHRLAHAKWMQDVADEMARWKRIREKMIEWAVLSGLGIVVIAVLRYAIQEGQK